MNKEASDLLAKLATEIYKNEQLQQKVNQLETNREEAIKKLEEVKERRYMLLAEEEVLEILERGKEW